MTAEQRDQLLTLHRKAVAAWGSAEQTGKGWPAAYRADDAFRDALYAIEVQA